jgi:hypothetical protein
MAVVTKNTPETSSVAAKPRRRWYQFTLRSAGVWMALLCLLLGSFAWWRDRAERQRKVVEELRGLGARVEYHYFCRRRFPRIHEGGEFRPTSIDEFTLFSWVRHRLGDDFVSSVDYVDLHQRTRHSHVLYSPDVPLDPMPSALPLLQQCKHLRHLGLHGNALTGAELGSLPCLESLEYLTLNRVVFEPQRSYRDDDLAVLRRCRSLQWLELSGQRISDSALEHVGTCRNLKVLRLDDTNIGDEGLRRLAELSAITHLGLVKTRVSDAGIKHLYGMKDLEVIWLSKLEFGEGRGCIKEHCPKCFIEIVKDVPVISPHGLRW